MPPRRFQPAASSAPKRAAPALDYEDYESEAFITAAAAAAAAAAPVPAPGRGRKRPRPAPKPPPTAAARAEAANAAPLPSSNIGFKLLSKMGHVPGTGLGKGGGGIVVPLVAAAPLKRSGVGAAAASDREAARRREAAEAAGRAGAASAAARASAFGDMSRQRAADRVLERLVARARRTVEELDTRSGAARTPLWPEPPLADVAGGDGRCFQDAAGAEYAQDDAEIDLDDSADDDQAPLGTLPPAAQLEACVEHLRRAYRYSLLHCAAYGDPGELERAVGSQAAELAALVDEES